MQWMAGHGINSVRIPIHYVHFLAGNPNVHGLLKGTEFEPYAAVYEGAWQRVVRAIQKAQQLNIGVLIDLHGVPGGQNKDGHSGKSDGKVHLWHGIHASSNRKLTIKILVALASAIGGYENVIGLELMNEPENSAALEGFYIDAIKAIRSEASPQGAELPLYIGDGWDTSHYTGFVNKHNDAGNPLVVDHHFYRCFTHQDHNTTASDHANHLEPNGGKTAVWLKKMSDKANGSIIVGEWSAALNPKSLHGHGNKQEAQRAYAYAEWQAFEHFTAGYYYWTLKKEGGPDPGWCLYTAMEQGIMPPSLNPRQALRGGNASVQEMQSRADSVLEPIYERHVSHWDSMGGKFKHDNFVEGFKSSWSDSLAFLNHDSEIGLIPYLAKLRLAAFTNQVQDKNTAWEFEHGYVQGAMAFRESLMS